MSTLTDFTDFVSEYNITIDEFMDIYCEFAEMPEDDRLQIIQDYTEKITGKKKRED